LKVGHGTLRILRKKLCKGWAHRAAAFLWFISPCASCVRAFEIYMRERKTQLLRAAAYKIAGERACSSSENGSREPRGRINKNFAPPFNN